MSRLDDFKPVPAPPLAEHIDRECSAIPMKGQALLAYRLINEHQPPPLLPINHLENIRHHMSQQHTHDQEARKQSSCLELQEMQDCIFVFCFLFSFSFSFLHNFQEWKNHQCCKQLGLQVLFTEIMDPLIITSEKPDTYRAAIWIAFGAENVWFEQILLRYSILCMIF